MNETRATPLDEVRMKGRKALIDALGPVDYIRFLQDINPGADDFTKERREWANGLTLSDLDRLLANHRENDVR